MGTESAVAHLLKRTQSRASSSLAISRAATAAAGGASTEPDDRESAQLQQVSAWQAVA